MMIPVLRILLHLDPVSLMRLEETSSCLRRHLATTWRRRAASYPLLLLPAMQQRWKEQLQAPKLPLPLTAHLKDKARSVRAWNLGLSWASGRATGRKLVSFNCNHDGCGERCKLR